MSKDATRSQKVWLRQTDCRAQNWIKNLQQETGEVGGKGHGLVHAMREPMSKKKKTDKKKKWKCAHGAKFLPRFVSFSLIISKVNGCWF
jgi:hypothetical protein